MFEDKASVEKFIQEHLYKKYAVIGIKPSQQGYSFSVFHSTLEKAKKEAFRLAEKEGYEFLVLKVVGSANKIPYPVEWVDIE